MLKKRYLLIVLLAGVVMLALQGVSMAWGAGGGIIHDLFGWESKAAGDPFTKTDIIEIIVAFHPMNAWMDE